ncbi:hypothetical protein [Novosphingobium sp. Fuku2-ISO-50]|jgi:hypothetical protein|uniref:hypothetical protein n=1 Tax=Novosphingobium sp. Fuku2-ISO-50 TaxID=1739114 RepID=UPI00076D255E|nr:hypothetical protein [Novosphingobium sp. Fuku2-ISO-50]KUR79267.1 hypothetical protein AQZ50_05385 [Novosphingobium sp. Fuku2-ISO-50]
MELQSLILGHPLLAAAAIAGAVALFGAIRDRMHSRRRDLDKVSLIAWGKVSALALIVAIACLAKGLRTGW